MNEYNKSNYALNKKSKGIVYQYADGSRLEITFEKIAASDPTFTEQDFEKLKEFSDELFHDEAKGDWRYNYHKTMPLLEDVNSDDISTPPLEDWLMKRLDDKEFSEKLRKAMADLLTPTQQRRLKMFLFEGLTTREIAKAEDTVQRAVWDSITASRKRLKNFFKKF